MQQTLEMYVLSKYMPQELFTYANQPTRVNKVNFYFVNFCTLLVKSYFLFKRGTFAKKLSSELLYNNFHLRAQHSNNKQS